MARTFELNILKIMKALLNVPPDLVQENTETVESVLKHYLDKDWHVLARIPATFNMNGQPVSYFEDKEWDLADYIDSRVVHKKRISYSQLSDFELTQELKILNYIGLYSVGSFRKSVTLKPSTFMTRHMTLLQIYKYLESTGGKSVKVLSNPARFNAFSNYLRSLARSQQHIEHILYCLSWIECCGEKSPVVLKIPTDRSIPALAKTIADPQRAPIQQFYAIPSRIMQLIYNRALQYVEDYYPYAKLLDKIQSELLDNYRSGQDTVDRKIDSGTWAWLDRDSHDYSIEVNKAAPNRPTDIIKSFIDASQLDSLIPTHPGRFQGLLSRIQTCCYLVCGAFTGMRRSEIFALTEGSFRRLQLGGKTYNTLHSYHTKLAAGPKQEAEWLTTPVTEKAIELAAKITANMRTQLLMSPNRKENEIASSLWLRQPNKKRSPHIMSEGCTALHFKGIVEEANAVITEDDYEEFKLINPNMSPKDCRKEVAVGKHWHLTSHQLRRTFAVFGKRYNLLSDVAIKQQFKHIHLPMSEWYGEGGVAARIKHIGVDNELQSLLEEIDKEVTTQTIYEWYAGETKLYGKMGKTIQRERIGVEKRYKSWEALYEQVSKGRISLVGTLHSYCLAGYECKMEKVTSPANCFNCENVVIDEEKANGWKLRHAWIVETIKDLEKIGNISQSQISHFTVQIRAAEKVMAYFEIPYEPFSFGIDVRQI